VNPLSGETSRSLSRGEAATRLREQTPEILRRWEARVRAEIPHTRHQPGPVLINNLPEFLQSLVLVVETGRKEDCAVSEASKEHAAQRARLLDYPLDRVLMEYQVLRQVLLQALEAERPLEQETRSDILDAIDRGLQDAASHFVDARQLLLEADRAKTEFLAMLAHELRNPLAPIRNAVELLKRIGPPEPRLIRIREIIDRQVSHQAHLLDDLLDVARISRGQIRLRRDRLDLVPLVADATEDSRGVLEDAGLHFSVELPGAPVWVNGDPTRLAQIVANLLRNAAKFTDPGGQVILRLEAEPDGQRVRISVRDTGIGIDPAMLPRVFQMFIQAERSLDRTRGGLGLGLGLVKGIAELHGGEARAHSEGVGRGAEFTVFLPTVADSAPPKATSHIVTSRTLECRVLIVEDNRDTAETLRDLLELSGCTVEVANAGPASIEKAKQFRPEVVICDLGLPGMDGYQVAQQLRRHPETAAARLIALSGYGQEEDQQRALQAGFNQHLTKPVAFEDLQRVLQEGLEPSSPQSDRPPAP
jgi:signal transduction histidine kinase/ActR/RegA family two-component response regulator